MTMSPSPATHPSPSPPRPEGLSRPRLAPGTQRDLRDEHDGLFPLSLTPFEQLFLLDESPSYPMQFFCRLRFRGRLQQQALSAALRVAQARHPLLSAIVHDSRKRGPCWWPCANPAPELQWLEQEPAEAFPPARVLDIRTQPGLRLTAVIGAGASDLVVQFHHAACDGIGASDFITDLLTAYANTLSGTNRYRLKPLDAHRLNSRGDLPLTGRRLVRWGLQQAPRLWPLWRFSRRRPVPLIPHRPSFEDPAPPPTYPDTCIHHFSSAESAALAALAHGSESSLNALLVRDLFVALYEWRTKQGESPAAWLRLMLPINMRTPADRRMPAANVVSTIFLDRCFAGGMDAARLLEQTNRLMDDIKRHDLGLAWLLALPILQCLPRGWENARRSRRRCQYSALLTNLGPVLAGSPLPRNERRLQVGDLTLEHVEFVPITRPLQCVGFGVSTYAGRMTLAMRYDSRVLRREQAQDVLADYVKALRTHVEHGA